MSRPRAFYYEDYDTASDPEYLYDKEEADREFTRLEAQLKAAQTESEQLKLTINKLSGGSAQGLLVHFKAKCCAEVRRKALEEAAAEVESHKRRTVETFSWRDSQKAILAMIDKEKP